MSISASSYSPSESPFIKQVRSTFRLKHLSSRTEESYIYYILDYIYFHHKRHPQEMGVDEIRAYLSHLATDKKVAASTQNIALSALLFLYRQVMQVELPNIDHVVRARQTRRLPVVLTRDEVKKLLANIDGVESLFISLLYGTGMRLFEGLRLRVKDLDFGRNAIVIRDGKGAEDRIVMLPDRLREPLQNQLEYARTLHNLDLSSTKVWVK